MLSRGRKAEIVAIARELHERLWSQRAELWSPIPTRPEFMYPLSVSRIITHFLNLTLVRPDYIEPEGKELRAAVAGFIDRRRKTIAIARGFPVYQQRFTAAHEVGHWFLHKGLMYHRSILRRDRPLDGPDLSRSRPAEEQEADAFAANFLMPESVLQAEVFDRFNGPINRNHHREELAMWLSSRNRELTPFHIAHTMKPLDLAFHVARATWFNRRHFDPLNERFGVSPTAMAIQLAHLHLVE